MSLASKNFHLFCSLAFLGFLSGSCGNIFEDYPDKTSNQYLMDQTRKFIDDENFDAAIEAITPVLNRERGQNAEVHYLASVAYAGRGGLRVIDIIENVASGSSTKGILQIFAESFQGSTGTNISDIETAVSILEEVGDRASKRTSEMNFYALFLYFGRLGVYLNVKAFTSANALRGNFTGCHTVENTAAASTGITNANVGLLYVTIPRIIETSSYVTGTDGGLKDILDVVDDLPTGLAFSNPPCETTPNHVNCLAVRTMINSAKPVGLNQGGACAAVTP